MTTAAITAQEKFTQQQLPSQHRLLLVKMVGNARLGESD